MANPTWDLIHAERRQLVNDLRTLTPEQWRTTSLCPDWTIHQMLGHIVALTKQTPPKFFTKLAVSGFRFDKMVAADVAKQSAGTPADTLAELTRHITDTTAPPGPVDSWVGEMVVHGADIRRPLGLTYVPPVATTRQVADFYKNSNLLIGSKRRINGVQLIATDTDWTHGIGPKVQGPILSLVQAMTGRSVAIADLTGEGVTLLSARMAPHTSD
ncbi:TIGR03083 family protein [Nakamurella panacisegetis]|uniref:TIGR03083 family protein n=1 Tax=Nakamurella panacisegetis TaxID=1090615 RepID=A0A1H0REE1_9ACTN|nr:maleylpyruvate isomerase family mycothiol-dependent enzyme [Nakamurella panacisegetis]SDP27982.1 TIGR03083 family protein [Nakamurella panacisegetis]